MGKETGDRTFKIMGMIMLVPPASARCCTPPTCSGGTGVTNAGMAVKPTAPSHRPNCQATRRSPQATNPARTAAGPTVQSWPAACRRRTMPRRYTVITVRSGTGSVMAVEACQALQTVLDFCSERWGEADLETGQAE